MPISTTGPSAAAGADAGGSSVREPSSRSVDACCFASSAWRAETLRTSACSDGRISHSRGGDRGGGMRKLQRPAKKEMSTRRIVAMLAAADIARSLFTAWAQTLHTCKFFSDRSSTLVDSAQPVCNLSC